ncbi:hypothetical protein L3X38_013409 [Prunus dulcis]|uniref:Transposable element protein n=1 Tax=Prunus dulcis TaxID=3755 RepID=A0AAD4ZG56_PRUDU|nr:hypothetical protein L3X38_013409 [Prunus dulcis]
MPGIAPEVISHKLSISPAYKPVRQKRRSYDAERYEAYSGFIREANISSMAGKFCDDQLVDATAGHELLSFMDAYSGYNQIFMHPPDSEHTAFITDKGLYCYNVMPFGLKSVKSTVGHPDVLPNVHW